MEQPKETEDKLKDSSIIKIYRFNTTESEIPPGFFFFFESKKLILRYIWSQMMEIILRTRTWAIWYQDFLETTVIKTVF